MKVALGLLLSATHTLVSGAELPFTNLPLFVGSDSAERSLYHVFRTEKEFLAHWPRPDGCDDSCVLALIERVDFSQSMVVVIAPRGRGQDTYKVAVTDVSASQDTIVVTFLELRHGPSKGDLLCGVLTIVPTPIAMIAIPRSDLPIRFFRTRAEVNCEQPVEVR